MSRALGRGGTARSDSLEQLKHLTFQLRVVYAQNKAIFTRRFNSLGRTWSGETGQGRAWWDDEKAARNLARHGVSFEAARLAFDDPFAVVREDRRRDYSEDRYVLLGMVENHLLAVVHTQRDARIRIISARLAEPRERRRYHEENS